jgi:CO dehydrogenase/acetyl-CoA synthase beta subunit
MMKLYDALIDECTQLLEGQHGRRLTLPKAGECWTDAGNSNLVLRGDMAYELGGNNLPAVSQLAFTESLQLVKQDEVWLYGPDLPQLKKDTSYARLTFLRGGKGAFTEEDELYSVIRKVEYTRYHINPWGYMMRISAASQREPVRVSRQALQEGLDFAKVGSMFMNEYHKHPKVAAVKMIFITQPDFPYEKLNEKAHQIEKITHSLNHIFNNLNMDCSACGLKKVCDEIEGLRELHFAQEHSTET